MHITALRHYLEIEVPEDAGDFTTAMKPIAETEANWERVLEAERARLQTPVGSSPFADPNALPEPSNGTDERVELEGELFEATASRYAESFGDLNGEHGSPFERESAPCHKNKYGFCSSWHSIAGHGIALFAQTKHYNVYPSVKTTENGEFENVACYYGATVLLVHGTPTTDEIKGRYRLNEHTVLVIEGVDDWFFGLDKPTDLTGKIREDITVLPLEKSDEKAAAAGTGK